MQVSTWILRAGVGLTWEFLHGNIFLCIIFVISTMNHFIFVNVERISEFYILVLIY